LRAAVIGVGYLGRFHAQKYRDHAGIDQARFRKPVLPGDVLRLELTLAGLRRGIYTFVGKAYVDDKLVAEAELKATFAAISAEGKA
jgi:3-hydroxymyristoyl/3-hydroxydecanoyl-(acyl carrier protein) dehydratase